MCGICGLAGRVPDLRRLRASMQAMEHRGPDQNGAWSGERVMLGHQRLSILDLSVLGRQPMENPAGTQQLVFNGEIFNFAELREQLRGRYPFRSGADTEVLLAGYEAWGIEGLLARIRGQFAFALWDAAAGTLHLARDHVGKKPLFYALNDGALAFASTLPSLLRLLPETPEVDPGAIQDYLLYLCVPGEGSMLQGVRKLPPAHRAEFRDGRLKVERYWSLSFARQEDRPEEEWLELVEAELRRAVRQRLVADVSVGVFLSGGVDSSLVTALASQEAPGRLTTISAGFEERAHDELEHSRAVARVLGTDHHEHVVRPDALSILPRLVHAAGEPFGDVAVLPTLLLSAAAREHVTVVLTGDGGDEGFAGYPGPRIARLAGAYRRVVPQWLRRGAPEQLARVARAPGRAGWVGKQLRRIAVPARGAGGLRWEYDALGERGFRGRFDGLFADSFAARLEGRDPDAYWQAVFQAADARTDADRVMYTELSTLLPDQFLVKSDVATMAYGLEARSPLLDVGVLEMAARIPVSRKLAGWESKRLLKRLATRYVPPETVYRKKQGFSVPLGTWFRGGFGETVEDILCSATAQRGIFRPAAVAELVRSHREGRADHGQRLWLLLMLELWFRVVLDGTLAPADTLAPAPAEPAGAGLAG